MPTIICKNCATENQSSSPYCFRCGYALPEIQTTTPVALPVPAQVSTKSKKRKFTIGSLIGFIIAYVAVQLIFFRAPSFDKTMMSAASELNKTCPFMVDKETRLDNTIALPDNIFEYNYTLVNIVKSQVDEAMLRNYLTPNIVNNTKTNPALRDFRNHKTTLAYNYRDKNGIFILKISVTPDLYQ
jgi:hypothetical protein